MESGSYPLARCTKCGEKVGIVYDPAQGAPQILCADCDRPASAARVKPPPTKADTKFVESFLSTLSPEEVLDLLKGE